MKYGKAAGMMDDLAELAARTVSGKSALILMRNMATNQMCVVGRHGTLYNPPQKVSLTQLLGPNDHFVAVQNIETDVRFVGHPLQTFVPKIKSLYLARLSSRAQRDLGLSFVVAIYNVSDEAFERDDKLSNFTNVINVCRQFVSGFSNYDDARAALVDNAQSQGAAYADGFAEPQPANTESAPTSKFLFDTLPKKQTLHERNGASYVSLRKWQPDIKSHQMNAFFATKKMPPSGFIDDVAEEMVQCAKRLYGNRVIDAVVPVPGGSSGQSPSLSERIAERLARKLSVACRHVLKCDTPVSSGKSHPLKSARLKSYSLSEELGGFVLLVDDVASSGKHLELAQMAMHKGGSKCFAMSWIGP